MARFLKRVVDVDSHLLGVYAVLLVFVLLESLHAAKLVSREVPTWVLLGVVTWGVMTLVADRLKESERVEEDSAKLGRIAESVFDKKAELRRRPSTPEEYDYLWGGLKGRYYVYNPSYRVDKNIEDGIIKIFVHRYQSTDFQARYLFLTKDQSGQDDLAAFRRLMAGVKQECPEVVKKIKVKELKTREASSEAELYLGTRDGRQLGVMELKEPSPDPIHGMPDYYLIVHDQEVLRHFHANHFDKAWDHKDATDVQIF